MERFVCIDIGGTDMKYGLADRHGHFLHKASRPTHIREEGVQAILSGITEIVQAYQEKNTLGGIAISTAGIVDPEAGKIIFANPHLKGYTGTELKLIVEAALALPCEVENDVNCAGLGEYWLGSGQGARSLFCITVGTGLGGCVILNGRLVSGAGYSADEVGFLRIPEKGTLEELASTTRLITETAEGLRVLPDTLNGRKIFALAKEGNIVAGRAIDRLCQRLALGMANICYVLDPELIVLGGGIMAQEEYLKPRLQSAFARAAAPGLCKHTRLAFARLHNDAGMLGALYNFLQRQGKTE